MWLFSPMERTTAPKAGKYHNIHSFILVALNFCIIRIILTQGCQEFCLSIRPWACYLRWHIYIYIYPSFGCKKLLRKLLATETKTPMQNKHVFTWIMLNIDKVMIAAKRKGPRKLKSLPFLAAQNVYIVSDRNTTTVTPAACNTSLPVI